MPPFRRPRRRVPHAAARERVLAAWHGVDLAPLEKAAAHSERAAADILPAVMRGLRLDRRRAEAEIVKVWNSAMDPNITAHAQPIGIRNGTVFVTVDSNVWLSEILRYRRREILDRLRNSFGSEMVKKISYRVG